MYKRFLLVVISVVFFGTALFAAQNAPGAKPGVAATVNGVEISTDDFTRTMYQLQRTILDRRQIMTAPQVARMWTETLDGLINDELTYQESKKTIQITDEEINREMEELRKQATNAAEFDSAAPSLRAGLARGLAIRKYIDTVYVTSPVTDQELKDYYEKNPNAFRQPELIKVSSILIKVDPQGGDAGKAEARKKIEDIRNRAGAGEDFAALARALSEDASTSARGGDMGYIRRGQLAANLENDLFSLSPGTVSPILATPSGFYIFKVMEHKSEEIISLDSVKDKVRKVLEDEKKRAAANAGVAELRKKATIQIFLKPEEHK